jgi:peptidoglycan/LPS O-acetylase OafA/YrhL
LPFLLIFSFVSFKADAGCAVMVVLVLIATSFPHLHPGPVTRMLSWRPLAVLGLGTYSVYLWHAPLITLLIQDGIVSRSSFWVLALVALPLSLAVGMLSYRVIEEPFLKMRRRWSRSAPPQAPPRDPEEAPSPAAG